MTLNDHRDFAVFYSYLAYRYKNESKLHYNYFFCYSLHICKTGLQATQCSVTKEKHVFSAFDDYKLTSILLTVHF